MDKDLARQIVEAGDSLTLDLKLFEGYSGRFMFGETTAGVVADSHSDFVVAVAQAVAYAEDPEIFANELAYDELRHDALGKGVIWY